MTQPSGRPEEASRPLAAPEEILTGLVQVGQALIETRDPERVAERIVATVLGLVDVRQANLFRLDPASGALTCIASWGEGVSPHVLGQTLPPGHGLSARVLAAGGSVWVADVLADAELRYPPWLERVVREEGLRAVAGVPLLARGRPLGVLVVSDRPGRAFTPEEIRLLDAFAAPAAVALETAELYAEAERHRREAELLAGLVGRISGSLRLEEVLQGVAEAARELCQADMAEIALREGDSGRLVVGFAAGVAGAPGEPHPIEPGKGLGGRVLETGRPFRTDDYARDPRISRDYLPWVRAKGIVAELAVPIWMGGRVEGVLFVSHRRPQPFGDREEATLTRLADHAAVAIANAHLYADLGRELGVRRQAEAALQRYRLLSDQARDIMLFVRRADGRVLEANAAAVEAYGYDREELLGLTIREIRSPEGHGQLAAQMAQADAGGVLFETVHRRKDGSTFPVEVSARGAEVVGERVLLSVIRDISARRASEAERARLGQAVEQAAEVVMITDLAGIIQYVNPAFERVTGYRREEVLGRGAGLLQSGRHPAGFYAGMWATLGRGETWAGTFQNRRKDGSRYEEEAVISPVRDATGEVVSYVAVKRDVTRERQMEAQLRQAQKMEAVGRLAGGVAHDFNNVLMAILGHCDLLRGRLDGDSPLREDVEEIRQAAERAAGLTRQLLTFSRRQVVQAGPLDLNGVLRGIDRLLGRLWGENIRPVHRLAEGLGPIWADRGQVEQIVMNLAVNARDAMPDGGVLTLATAEVEVGEGPGGRPAELPPGRYVTLMVADTGIGMDAEVQAHLFEPFFTTKPTGLGTGLGLATVYGIVRQCGGGITVESAPGHGTTVTVHFPRSAAPAPAAPPPPLPPPAEPPARETILLAEDDPGVRTVVREVLRMRGYTVLEAADGFEALRVAGEHPGRVDLLLTDVVMPGMRGPTLVEQLLPLRPGIRVLFMSGYPDDSFVRQGIRGAKHFLQKPFTTEALTRMVRQALGGEPPGGQSE